MTKCSECGYLYVRETKREYPASELVRTKGVFEGSESYAKLCCKAQSPAFPFPGVQRICNILQDDGTGDEKLVATLESEHGCELAAPYDPVKTPEELEEMEWRQLAVDTQGRIADLHQQFLNFQKEQAKRDADFQKEQAKRDADLSRQIQAIEEERHQERMRGSTAATRWQLVAAWVGIIITAVLSIAALLKG